MPAKHDTCPYCKTVLANDALSRIKRAQQFWGVAGIMLGFIGAGFGINFGNAV